MENKEVVSDRTIYFARGNICIKLTRNRHGIITELATDHEQANTKIDYLIEHFVEHKNKDRVGIAVRSTIVVKNNETNDKFYRKVAFPRYTESVKFRSQSRETASKRKSYRGLGTR